MRRRKRRKNFLTPVENDPKIACNSWLMELLPPLIYDIIVLANLSHTPRTVSLPVAPRARDHIRHSPHSFARRNPYHSRYSEYRRLRQVQRSSTSRPTLNAALAVSL